MHGGINARNNMLTVVLVLVVRTESKPELVKTEMGPPPSPASTCSDTSSIASSASLPYSMYTGPLTRPLLYWVYIDLKDLRRKSFHSEIASKFVKQRNR